MDKKIIIDKINNTLLKWTPPEIKDPQLIPKGDMPGDKIAIEESHIQKANNIFKTVLKNIESQLEVNNSKIVISVHGGSGVGKSEIGSILSFYLNNIGIGSYVLSGDNYPHRTPMYNDAERERVYRTSGVKGLVEKNSFNSKVKEDLQLLWSKGEDSNQALVAEYDWLYTYQKYGVKGLTNYLGTPCEIDFEQINEIIKNFKKGEPKIYLKRMGREISQLWYDTVDFSTIDVLIIEWTHGNNPNLVGVDIPILLNSTPAETLAHRKSRNRDNKIDSSFTTTVLAIEQDKLKMQASTASIIVAKNGSIINYDEFQNLMEDTKFDNSPMLNAYPDSIGNNLDNLISLLNNPVLENCFKSLYILPSIFNTDLDRGFSVIDYNLNKTFANNDSLKNLENLDIDLKMDFILNHSSVLSKQFQDIIKNGRASKYADFFIDWNKFWEGCGTMDENGVIVPRDEYIKDMFFRKPGLPILMVRMPDGEEVPYWNTFYQEVKYDKVDAQDIMKICDIQFTEATQLEEILKENLQKDTKPNDIDFGVYSNYKEKIVNHLESTRKYLGQMDLNINSPLVWKFYDDTLKKLSSYGAKIVRLDAFAYAPKAKGAKNFLNEPDTWELLAKIKKLSDKYNLTLLPEIHSKYEDFMHTKISSKGFMTYDFFLPGLIIDALERNNSDVIKKWAKEIIDNNIKTVNMLGCHDGIPLLDLKGLLSDQQIQSLIDIVVSRGGYVKDLHGKQNIYYQVNATYYSALGEDDKKFLFARAIQMFMPGKPQVWYLDLFAGKNNYDALKYGHKEINRTNLTIDCAYEKLKDNIVLEQIKLIKLRNNHKVFKSNAKVSIEDTASHILKIIWTNNDDKLEFTANFKTFEFEIK